MEQIQDLLFITFVIKKLKPEFEVRCCGCREILMPEYKTPVHILGMIKSDDKFIPVMDPSIWFLGGPTRLTTSSCILIVEHNYEYRQLKTGIIISDSEELMEMAASGNEHRLLKNSTFNIRFIRELSGNAAARDFLADSHKKLNMCWEQRRTDDDFTAFKEIVLRGLAYA